jgi:hypothetical protein
MRKIGMLADWMLNGIAPKATAAAATYRHYCGCINGVEYWHTCTGPGTVKPVCTDCAPTSTTC